MNMVKAGGETGQQIVDNMSSQQSTSSTSNNIYVTNNNPQKELIEDKKRKMTLPLDSGGGGGDGQMNSQNQNNLTLQQGSNMLTGFTPTNSKKIKTYFTPVGLVNAPSDPLNKDLSNQIDFGLSLSTPQIEKFISEMQTSALRTPGSALAILTPGGLAQNPFFSNSGNTSSYLQQNGLQDSSSSTVFDANNNNVNNNNNHTAYQLLNNSNMAHSATSSTESNASSSNNSSNASMVQQQYPNIQATIVGSANSSALTPTTALINPLNIFGVGLANNPLQQQQQQQIHAQQQNDNTGGSNVVLPAQNYYVLQPINKDQPLMNTIQLGVDATSSQATSTNGLQLANGLNNQTTTGTTLDLKQNMLQNMLPQQIKIKDELQTVPIHPNNHLHMQQQMNQLNNNKSKKSNSKQTGQTSTTTTAATTSTKIKSIPTTSLSSTGVASASAGTSSMMMASKIESSARRNTDASSVTSSNDLNSPLNMDDQETFKLEKKRERNREAARKCRTRKLEKIAELEQQVKVLNDASDAQRSKIRALQAEIQELHIKFEAHQKMNNCDLKY